jgi:hypothetical protein
MKQVNQVMMTNDYDMFETIDGNREVNKIHLRRLKESIKEKYITVPIIVNEYNQIIDGQHRFQSAKELEMPVYYIKVNGLGLKDVHRLNTNTKNWTADAYLDGYCKLGKEDYIMYRNFKQKYGFGHNETNAILTARSRMGGNQNQAFKDGTFKIINYHQAVTNAEKICMISKFYDGYKRRAFVYAMLDLFENPQYNHAEFLNKLSFQSVKLVDCTDVQQYLILIEEIYNFKRNKQTKVYFR